MGGNMTERLIKGGHEVVAFDRTREVVDKYVVHGATGAYPITDFSMKLKGPRIVWIRVPAGKPVDETIAQLLPGMSKGDVIIDGGNSNFHDSMRRAAELQGKGMHFVDSGTSGGIWGLANGYCLMIGASDEAFGLCEPIFKTLAPPDGYAHMGPPAWALREDDSPAQSMECCRPTRRLRDPPCIEGLQLDLHKIAAVWKHGRVSFARGSTSWRKRPSRRMRT
jgi:6-phosphogluconate dehydrogenase